MALLFDQTKTFASSCPGPTMKLARELVVETNRIKKMMIPKQSLRAPTQPETHCARPPALTNDIFRALSRAVKLLSRLASPPSLIPILTVSRIHLMEPNLRLPRDDSSCCRPLAERRRRRARANYWG